MSTDAEVKQEIRRRPLVTDKLPPTGNESDTKEGDAEVNKATLSSIITTPSGIDGPFKLDGLTIVDAGLKEICVIGLSHLPFDTRQTFGNWIADKLSA